MCRVDTSMEGQVCTHSLVFYEMWLHPSGYVFKWSELTMISVGSEETGAVVGFREDVD